MDFDDAAVNHGIFHIRPTADFRQDSGKAPCFAPARVTLDTLFHLPNSLGKSRHGLPVRTIPQHGFYKHTVISGWSVIISLACTVPKGSIFAHRASVSISLSFITL